jgi:hypothetical protein
MALRTPHRSGVFQRLHHRSGQTSLEYLMLLSLAFITAYIVIRGPMSIFTRRLLGNIFSGIQNLVTNAEWTTDDLQPFQGSHPSSQKRLKPLHL